MPRDLDLTFDISTGALTLDRVVGNYVKRSETLTLSVTIVSNGASATIPAGLVGTLKPVNTYGTTLAQWTTFAQVGATNVYTASTTINAAAVTTLLGTTTEQANCVFDFAGTGVVESDTLALVLKNNVTRDDDTAPTALLNRNDFLVSNGTGLLVNVAAGYAANGAFVAAQASLAITNATNYIEVTAAGVASVNTTAFTAGSYPLATVVASAGAITANTDLRAWITPKPAAAGGVTSITGTANEITVTGTTTPTLSLPSALTFTGKTVTGGTFTGGTIVLPQVGYLAATFDYFEEWMTFISSTDAATWKRTHTTPIVTTEGTIRDPALHYVAATGTFYVAYTRNAFTGGNSWGLGSSTDGRTWTWSTISTGSLATGTPAYVWIGDWFTDSDGTDHVLFAANTTASQAAGGLYLYETHPTTPGDYSAWSTPVQITGSAITNNLGNSPAVIKVGSTYHLFYDLPSAGGIRHVTSSSLTSGYDTAGTYPAFPSATEGPAIITLANGTYRLYAEQNYQQSTAGLKYSDSTDLVTWGSVQSAVTQGYMGHPHGIQVTSQELLNKVSMLEQGQKDPFWSALRAGELAGVFGYPDPATEAQIYPGFGIYGGAAGSSFLNFQTRGANGAAIFTDPNSNSPASNNFYIARRSGLNYMRFDGGTNNVSFYGTATFLGSTSGSATISVSATGGLLALPSGTTATNMALTTPDLGTPSAIVLTNASGTAASLTAGNATLAATVTVANEATDTTCFPLFATAATGSLAAMSNAGLTFNSATGLLSATGLAGAFNGTVGATTPDTVAGTTGTFDSTVTVGANSQAGTLNITNSSGTTTASISGSDGSAAFGYNGGLTGLHIDQFGNLSTNNNAEANLFAFNASNYVTAAAGAITLGTNTGTAAWIHSNGSASFGSGSCTIDQYGYASFASGTFTATTSLLLGTAGSAVGTIGFNNATSGTTTLEPATGALGTGTVTLPLTGTLATLAGTETLTNKSLSLTSNTLTGTLAEFNAACSDADLARTSGTNTFTGVQSMTSPAITTSITTPSTTFALLNTTATTVNFAGAATAINIGAATATLKLGTATSTSTATPAIFDCGGTYADSVTSAKAKWKLYSDGTAINTYGIGISFGKFNFFTTSSGAYSFLFSDVEKANLSNAGLLTLQGGLIATTGAFSSTLAVTGATTLTGNLTSNGALISTPQALSGAGAVNVTTLTTAFTSTGAAQALSLADGTSGQLKTISHVVDGGSGVLTPTTKSGYTTITFTNVGDSVTLQYHTTAGWCIVGVFGAVPA